VICGWHVQKNLISRFAKLADKDRVLYDKIISLPFITSKTKFNDTINEINESEDIKEEQKGYIESKLANKNEWAKFLLKSTFVGGVSTTSRIEGFHAVQKKYLTSDGSLQKIFHSFFFIENIQITKFQDEFERHSSEFTKHNINALKDINEQFPHYVYKKIYPKFCKALNYKYEMISKKSW